MTHPLFRQDIFIETAFARRFQAMLRSSWSNRSWHVIVADPGAGKTMSIRDLRKTAGGRSMLTITTPKNNEEEQALGDQLYTALGLPLRGYWPTRKPKLMGYLHQYGTEFLVVDDAHDLSLKHLMFIKELTDQGKLQYDHPLGLCLVAAGRGNTIPLKETLDQPETTWVQFRRRFDKLQPFCRIAGHTSEEVREILASLETAYQELFPHLNLRQWTGFIYTWLTQSAFDPNNSGRVTMDYLMKLVTIALEWSYQAGDTEVRAETLEKAADLLVLRRDTLRIIDGEGPDSEAPSSASPSVAQTSETGQVPSSPAGAEQSPTEPLGQKDQARPGEGVAIPATTSSKCTFLGMVSIDIKRFEESGVSLVECPDCGRTWTLSPRGGTLRFKSHDKRKTNAPNTGKRWARGKTDWDIVGGGGK